MNVWQTDGIIFGTIGTVSLIRVLLRGRGVSKGKYRKAGPLLTPTEALFYRTLRQAVPDQAAVMCKVRLYDVCQPVGDGRNHGLMMRQHLDFVIVAKNDFRALCVVELDDPRHGSQDARRRDWVKDHALSGAGVPLVRVRTASRYDAKDIAARLTPIMQGAGLAQALPGGMPSYPS